MELAFDALKFILLNLARLLVIATLIFGGVKTYDYVASRLGDEARVTETQLRAHLQREQQARAEALAAEEEAAKAYRDAEFRASRERVDAQRALENASAQQGGLAATHAAEEARLQRLSNAVADELGAADDAQALFSPTGRDATFQTLCRNKLSMSPSFCRAWKDAAVARSRSAPDAWVAQLGPGLDDVCGFWQGGGLFTGGVSGLSTCTSRAVSKRVIEPFVSGVGAFTRAESLDAQLAQLDGRIRALHAEVEAIAPPESLREAWDEAIAAKQAADRRVRATEDALANLNADPWTRFMGGVQWFWDTVVKSKFMWIAASIVVAPYLVAWLVYVLAGLIQAVPPFRMRDAAAGELVRESAEAAVFTEPGASTGATLQLLRGVRQLPVTLQAGEPLVVRANYVSSSYRGGALLMYNKRTPFSSYAAGLVAMTRFQGDRTPQIMLGASGAEHHDEYIAEIRMENHPGVVVRPHRVVAVKGELVLRRRWNFGLSSFFRFQFGYFYFAGTGSVYVTAPGGVSPRVVSRAPGGEAREHLAHDLLIAWDSRLGVGPARNENWIQSALLRNQDLFESAVIGQGAYLQGHSAKENKRSGATRLLHGMLDVVLKVFGI